MSRLQQKLRSRRGRLQVTLGLVRCFLLIFWLVGQSDAAAMESHQRAPHQSLAATASSSASSGGRERGHDHSAFGRLPTGVHQHIFGDLGVRDAVALGEVSPALRETLVHAFAARSQFFRLPQRTITLTEFQSWFQSGRAALSGIRFLDLSGARFELAALGYLPTSLEALKLAHGANLAGQAFDFDQPWLVEVFRARLSHLQELDLSGMGLTDQSLESLTPALAELRGLKKLNLEQNQLGQRGMGWLRALLPRLPALEVLFLNENKMNDQGVELLAEGLEGVPQLKRLEIAGNEITGTGAGRLAQALARFSHLGGGLEALDISDNHIGLQGATTLVSSLAAAGRGGGVRPTLWELRMENCGIGARFSENALPEEGGLQKSFSQGLAALPELSRLLLGKNSLGDLLTQQILSAWRGNSRLQTLDLAWNRLTDEIGVALALSFKKFPRLRGLGLRGNSLGDPGMATLAAGFKEVSRLSYLDLSDNHLGVLGTGLLVDHLGALPELESLGLAQAQFTAASFKVFNARLRSGGESFTALDLSECGLSWEWLAELGWSLRQMPHLRVLRLAGRTVGPYVPCAVKKFAAGLRVLTQLLELDFSHVFLGGGSAAHVLLQGLSAHPGLRVLNLTGCDLAAKAMQPLSRALRSLPLLEELYLGEGQWDDLALDRLGRHLQFVRQLRRLELRANPIYGKTLERFASSLRQLRWLRRLDLSENEDGLAEEDVPSASSTDGEGSREEKRANRIEKLREELAQAWVSFELSLVQTHPALRQEDRIWEDQEFFVIDWFDSQILREQR